MTTQGVRKVRITAFQCVLCQTVYPAEEEAANCYQLCVTADEDPIWKLFAYQRRELQKAKNPSPAERDGARRGTMGKETVIKAGVMVYTIADGKLYSDSLPKEGAELLKIISQEPGKQFEAIVKIRGHLWHLWSGKPVDEIRESVDEGDESIDLHEALAEYEAAKFRAQMKAAHHIPDFPWV